MGLPTESLGEALDLVPSRLLGLLRDAQDKGWQLGKTGCTTVMRVWNPIYEALPFYVRWDLTIAKDGKASWRFHSARAQNGQRLNWNDIKTYLSDPSVIYPEPPEGEQDD